MNKLPSGPIALTVRAKLEPPGNKGTEWSPAALTGEVNCRVGYPEAHGISAPSQACVYIEFCIYYISFLKEGPPNCISFSPHKAAPASGPPVFHLYSEEEY